MEDTIINNEDYNRINAFKGYSIGFNSEVISFTQLDDELIERFRTHLIQGKGLLIKYLVSKEQSHFSIAEIMEKIDNLVSNNCEIVFGTEVDDELKSGECKFHIQITGLDKI